MAEPYFIINTRILPHYYQKAVILLTLMDQVGVLSQVLQQFAKPKTNILTINQSIPLRRTASLSASLDISELNLSVDEPVLALSSIHGVNSVQLSALE